MPRDARNLFRSLQFPLLFGIKNWEWCKSGKLAVFSDSQEVLYLWNAINHKLMGKICLNQLDALKQQNPIVFREQTMRNPTVLNVSCI